MIETDPALDAYLERTAADRMASYAAFLRIPSISAIPAHADDCRKAAGWLAGALETAGLEHAAVVETGGHPLVYADWLHASDAPTVLVYGHYDVQPVDPLDLWTSPPFEPVVVGGRMLARGAADDKGQVHAHIMSAAAVLATRQGFPVNLRYLFEGEEESSSVHLDAWLRATRAGRRGLRDHQRHLLLRGQPSGHLVLPARAHVCPGRCRWHGRRSPFGQLRWRRPEPGQRPRRDHRRAQGTRRADQDPRLLRRRAAAAEVDRAAFADLPFDDGAYREKLGLPALVGEAGFTILERRGARPTLDVNGIWGGFQGEGSKTIIPAHAHAKISCRLVADQDPDRVFEALKAYVEDIAPPGVTVSVRYLGGGQPSLSPIDHPATQAAARALEASFGRPPLYIREGGSIPVAASFSATLGLPVVLFGFTQPDENAHAPNEWMDLANYEAGIRAIARLWDELADLQR
jgi:acetylornithine deacetylase/succinyl-diaminopimelate desuccinylase-like protein